MERKFCHECGGKIIDGARFCPSCGQVLPQKPVYIVGKKPIPGRGFAISSLVLGIIGLFFAIIFFDFSIALEGFSFSEGVGNWRDIYQTICTLSVFACESVLALIFGRAASKRGYSGGAAVAGTVLGIIGIVLFALMFFFSI